MISISSGVAEYTAATPAYLQFLDYLIIVRDLKLPTTICRSKVDSNYQSVLWHMCWRHACSSRNASIVAWIECIRNVAPLYGQCIVHDSKAKARWASRESRGGATGSKSGQELVECDYETAEKTSGSSICLPEKHWTA